MDVRQIDNKYFTQLEPAEELTLREDVSVFSLYGRVTPTPGVYWIRLSYHNYHWLDTLPPVWIGTVSSDTVWFSVIEGGRE